MLRFICFHLRFDFKQLHIQLAIYNLFLNKKNMLKINRFEKNTGNPIKEDTLQYLWFLMRKFILFLG